jgi:hypothetical protein
MFLDSAAESSVEWRSRCSCRLTLAPGLKRGKLLFSRDPAAGKIVSAMKTVAETVAMLHDQLKLGIDHNFDADPIGNIRLRQFLIMEDCLNAIGFPTEDEHKARVSLAPYIFQEANYDGISWTDQQNADLAGMSIYFDLDFIVQNQGRQRNEVTAEEFAKYVDDAFRYIDLVQAAK